MVMMQCSWLLVQIVLRMTTSLITSEIFLGNQRRANLYKRSTRLLTYRIIRHGNTPYTFNNSAAHLL